MSNVEWVKTVSVNNNYFLLKEVTPELKATYYPTILPKRAEKDPLEILDIPVKVEIHDEEEEAGKVAFDNLTGIIFQFYISLG